MASPPNGGKSTLTTTGETMSNLRDVVGLSVPYGKSNSQYQTEFDPTTATVWGYFNPRGSACYSLSLLKDIREHDGALAANAGQIEFEGALRPVHYYVTGSGSGGGG